MKKFIQIIIENDLKEKNAERKFRYALKAMHPDGVHVYHETPGHVAKSIKEKGVIDSQYNTVFGTVDDPSGFVSSTKKTITHFVIPHSLSNRLITHDMRYSGYSHLIDEHPNVRGSDISIDGNIPREWIKSVKEVGP
jgi:hypothetical protein